MVVNDRLVTEDHRFAKDDWVKLIRVVSADEVQGWWTGKHR